MVGALLYLPIVVLGGLGALIYRAAPHRFDVRVLAVLAALSVALFGFAAMVLMGDLRVTFDSWMRINITLTILQCFAVALFAASFPFNRAPSFAWTAGLGTVCAIALVMLWMAKLGASVALTMYCGFFAPFLAVINWFLVRNYRRITQPRVATGMQLVIVGILTPFVVSLIAFPVGMLFGGSSYPPNPVLVGARFSAQLVGTVLVARAVLSYHLLNVRMAAAELLLWLLGGTVAIGGAVVAAHFASAWLVGERSYAVVAVGVVFLTGGVFWVLGILRPQFAERIGSRLDPSWRRGHASVEEALTEARRLADSTLVEARVTGAIREFLAAQSVDVLRVVGAATGVLSDHQECDEVLVQAACRRGFLALEQIDEFDPPVAAAFRSLGGELVLPLMSGSSVLGIVRVSGVHHLERPNIDEARRLADVLAHKVAMHHLYAELEQARRLAVLGAFAAGLAHEIRTPLSSIRMNMQILRRKADLPGSDREYLDIALDEMDRLNREISDVLDFARPLALRPQAFDVRKLVSDAARQAEAVLSERGVRFTSRVADGLQMLYGDADRLGQVVVNLIVNAAHASAVGQGVEVEVRKEERAIALIVRDQGCGIKPENLPKLFEPFFTTRPDGTGLGLAIARKIAQSHGGELTVTSTMGRGSEFRLRLPLRAQALTPPIGPSLDAANTPVPKAPRAESA